MKNNIFTVLIIIFILICGTAGSTTVYDMFSITSLSQYVQQSSVSIFSVGQAFGFCSGVIIDENQDYTYVLTAKHCIGPSEEMLVENNKAIAIFTPTDDDLALIVVEGKIPNKGVAILAKSKPLKGDYVIHIGYPNLNLYKSLGTVLRDSKDWQWASLTSIGGCSGGGVYNDKGELVGILWGGFADTAISAYEPVEDIRAFIINVSKYTKI